MRKPRLNLKILPMELALLYSQKRRTLDFLVPVPPLALNISLISSQGPSSNIAFIRQIVRTTTVTLKTTVSAASPTSLSNAASQSHMLYVSRPPSPVPNPDNLYESAPIGAEPFILPPGGETLQLIDIFFSTTGVLFPYIDKNSLLETYHQLNPTNIHTAPRPWLGLLNMLFAMSTSAGHIDNLTASERATKSDIYFRRALKLLEKQIRRGTSLETGECSNSAKPHILYH